MRVVVTGSTGLIGTRLTDHLRAGGHRVERLVRHEPHGDDEIAWDPRGGVLDAAALEGCDAVVHLAGEPIDQRWTKAAKERIMRSREEGTRIVATALAALDDPPRVLLSASAIGYYGLRGDEVLTEEDAPGDDFLAQVCRAWEAACVPAVEAGIRVVNARNGIVLARQGGALGRMLTPFKMGLGGRVGPGDQWWSWISLTDCVRAIEHALGEEALRGPLNLVAPRPEQNESFVETLGNVLRRPTILPLPTFMVKLMFGEMGKHTILASQRVSSTRLEKSGFRFAHSQLEEALRAELGRPA